MSMGPWDGPKADALDLATQEDLSGGVDLVQIGAKVYNSTAQSLSTGASWTALTFNSELYDYGGCHSTSSNTGRLTAPVDGIYQVSFASAWASNNTGTRAIAFRKNGTTYIASRYDPANGTSNSSLAEQVYLAAGDYVEVMCWQTSGGNLNMDTQSQYAGYFSFARIAAGGTDTYDQWTLLHEIPICYWPLDAGTAFGYIHSPLGAMQANGFLGRTTHPDLFRVRSADFKAISGKTLKLRTRLIALTNATDPNVNLDFDIRPVTTAGGADATTWALGSAVGSSGGQISNANLGASDQEEAISASFGLPADGLYAMLVVPSGTIANNATLHTMGRVEYRWE